LTLIGPPGLGKTTAGDLCGDQQISSATRARFLTAQTLASQVSRASTSVGRRGLLKPLLSTDVLVLDRLATCPPCPPLGQHYYEIIAGGIAPAHDLNFQ